MSAVSVLFPPRRQLTFIQATLALLACLSASGCPSSSEPGGDEAAGGQGNGFGEGGADGSLAGSTSAATPPDGPQGQALDEQTGALDVDYAQYLGRADVVYEKPNDNPAFGLTVGSGKVGAMVWNDDALRMQVSGVDLSPQGTYAAGRVAFSTTPSLASAVDDSSFEQRLVLHDGLLKTHYGPDVDITIVGRAKTETLGIVVEDRRKGVSSATVELSLWDVSALANLANVDNLQTWQTVSTFADSSAAGLSRGQADPDNFGYSLAATVEGASFSTSQVDSNTVRLSIAPTASYTIWLVAASRLEAPAHDSVAAARSALVDAKKAGREAIVADAKAFWHDFWSRSFVQYSNGGDADYLQAFYYLATYVIAAGGYGDYPFHFINGVFRATADDTKWSNAYWYWNQRDVYASFATSNHLELLHGWNRMYTRNSAALLDYTAERYASGGLWVPETMGWDGSASGTIGSDYTKDILSTATEAALNLYREYLHSGDQAYLENTVYPFVREAARFYVGRLSHDDANDQYFMANSNAHETYWEVKNAITDLAAVRALFPIAIALSKELDQDTSLRQNWQDVLDHLVAYPELDGTYAPHQPPITATKNGENIVCELIWPYSVGGLGSPDQAELEAAWRARPFPYGNVWANDAIQAARLGLGAETLGGMRTMLQKYQTYPNGFTDNTNGVFEYWGVHLSAMNEALLQSHGGTLRVFPALPDDASLVTRFTLHAEGGFLVSSEREDSKIKYVAIESERGESVRLVNPWGAQPVEVRKGGSGAVILASAAGELSFETASGGLYVVTPKGQPLSSYTRSHIESSATSGPLTLSDQMTTLGIARFTPEQLGKYEAENATLVDCNASSDPNASGRSEVVNLQQGSSLTFADVREGTSIDIRYCTQNDPGRLALYVNGNKTNDLVFASTGSWDTTYETLTMAVTVSANSTLELRYEAGGSGANIDFLQVK